MKVTSTYACWIVAAAMMALLPGAAFAASPVDRPAIDKLLDQLQTAPDEATAATLNAEIWTLWLMPNDPEIGKRMSAVMSAERTGDGPAALDLLGKLTTDFPDYAEGWNQRATIEFQLHNYDASLADIDKVLALEPRHFGALSGKVLVLLAEGKRPEALKAMIAALAVDPFLAERQLFPELDQPATKV